MSIAHFTLATRDVIATRDFFAETLGWEPIARPDNVEVDAAWLRIAPGRSCTCYACRTSSRPISSGSSVVTLPWSIRSMAFRR